jgi:hypothetical protein
MAPDLEIRDNGDGTVTVSGFCRITGKPHAVTVPAIGLKKWNAGDYIQNALPEATPDEREWLMTRTSPEGWEKLFPKESEDESLTNEQIDLLMARSKAHRRRNK